MQNGLLIGGQLIIVKPKHRTHLDPKQEQTKLKKEDHTCAIKITVIDTDVQPEVIIHLTHQLIILDLDVQLVLSKNECLAL